MILLRNNDNLILSHSRRSVRGELVELRTVRPSTSSGRTG
jgi:hypothetical protein